MTKITKIKARQILDSRGNPTIEVKVEVGDIIGIAKVPSGASTGIHEAVELRDNKRNAYGGKGVTKAVDNVNKKIARALKGKDVTQQRELDNHMLRLDGTANKANLGANAILGVSMAVARAAAKIKQIELYEYIAELAKTQTKKYIIPVPFANIINGGKHAGNELQLQEFMIVPTGAKSFKEATQIVSETYHALKKTIAKTYDKNAINVGDEGGFAPPVKTAEEALTLVWKTVEKIRYHRKISLAIDAAASEFLTKDKKYNVGIELTTEELSLYYIRLLKKYPIISLEDPFGEDDFAAFRKFFKLIKQKRIKAQIVGDDLTVTNVQRIKEAQELELCNALLLKVNQIGSVSEAIDAFKKAKEFGWNVTVSHRSGETDDAFIADFTVGIGCGQIKLGAPCRGERVAKYNRLLEIEENLKRKAVYPNIKKSL